MDKADLKRMAVEAAMDRIVGTTTVPIRHFADLVKKVGVMIDGYSAEFKQWREFDAEQKKFLREIQEDLNEYAVELVRIRQIKGEKGDAGINGKDGRDGRDGKDAKEVDVDKLVSRIIKQIRTPKDGQSPVIDYAKLTKMLSKEIDLSEYIKTLDNQVTSYRSQLAGKHYGTDTWARGSGTTVSAGANITLTPLANGTVQINASGGGSGTNVTTQYQVTAVQAGSNVTIDLSQLTNFATYQGLVQLQRNNIPQTETLNFTQTPTEITVFEADASEIFNIVYQYA